LRLINDGYKRRAWLFAFSTRMLLHKSLPRCYVCRLGMTWFKRILISCLRGKEGRPARCAQCTCFLESRNFLQA
jgi:hypothetical protein